ncbi:MAG: nicotinate (nicotinamide) nucleotide adenylyltransferase [Anaerolineales bacterium]|nr:nicotinate (nicotinamide) nucleotide adenylyltransferase [Anaerolineales bacterium]
MNSSGRTDPLPRRIGIFGGTFDPPHFGHLILAAEAQYQLKLDILLFVLTPDPPHKQGQSHTNLDDRIAMLAAAIEGHPGFVLSRVDIDRPGPHFTVETLHLLREEFPEDTLIYLMGGDSLEGLLVDWHRPDEFVAACDLIGVMRRPQDHLDMTPLETAFPGICEKVQFVEAPLLEIASSQIRSRVREGRPFIFYLPETVRRVIAERGIYSNFRQAPD